MNVLIAIAAQSEWQGFPTDITVGFCDGDVDSLDSALNDTIEILVTEVMPRKIDHCEGLRWVQLISSGAEQLINHPLLLRSVLFSDAAGICSVHIAEFVVAQVLRHFKEVDQIRDLQDFRQWGDRPALARPCLRGLRAVIVGYGGVGREVARLFFAFGMKITAVGSDRLRRNYSGYMPYRSIGDPDGSIPEEIVSYLELSDGIPDADVVVLCVSLNASTHHLINAGTLKLMKHSAILINVSRGAVVDTQALLVSLDRGEFNHAYLDVFDQEPLPGDSPLWTHPKISISPHMAGVMPDHSVRLKNLFLENLERYRRGLPLINQLYPERFIEPSYESTQEASSHS